MAEQLIVFDMDGVLVDVTESYRETIVRVVEHFTGSAITHPQIQDYKNEGGWNDDWKLSHHVIRERGVNVEFQTVVDYFQKLFHGNGADGMILRERWLAHDGLFERLAGRFDFALFTGRMRWEAEYTLGRFAPSFRFAPIIGMDEAPSKPAPDGLLMIAAAAAGRKIWYVGDTVDDARSARAAVPTLHWHRVAQESAARGISRRPSGEKAVAVIEDINQLESVLG